MKITISRWTAKSAAVPDIGTYKTTVTIRTESLVCGVTLNGHLSRKRALELCYRHLHAENRWSPEFLRQVANGGAA